MKGHDGPVCGARTRQNKNPCQRPAGWGTDHLGAGQCKHHGGALPRVALKAHVTLARREFTAMGCPIDDLSPAEAILECIRIAAGEVQYASDRVAELTSDELIVGDRSEHDRPLKLGGDAGESTTDRVTEVKSSSSASLHVWVRVRQEAMDRLVTYSSAAIKANVDERLVTLAESQARTLASAMRAFAVAMGFDPADPVVRGALRSSLVSLEGSAVEITDQH